MAVVVVVKLMVSVGVIFMKEETYRRALLVVPWWLWLKEVRGVMTMIAVMVEKSHGGS